MKLQEKTVLKRYLYKGKIINLRCDDALLPDGNLCKREIIEHSGGAAVYCEFEGKVVLVRQYRYAYGEELLEIPAGKLNAGEDSAVAAVRELKEETGFLADALELVLILYPTPGYTNEKIYIYRAKGVRAGERSLDKDEFLNVEYLSPEALRAQIESGKIHDAKTVAAYYVCNASKT